MYCIWKVDHVLSSCIEVVYVMKVIIIVGTQSTSCINAGPSVADSTDHRDSEWLSTSTVTHFEASITEKNSIAQYSFRPVRWHAANGACVLYIAQGYL